MEKTDQFITQIKPTWCPGCGNFGIWMALKNALSELAIPTHKVAIVYGVGCHGNMCDWLDVYGSRGLHGRALPLAQGLKMANTDLTVIAVMGDGDCLGEGGNHFIHAAKRNPNVTALIHNNEVYGLTTGQASPTAQLKFVTKSTPGGTLENPINPLALALVSGGTFAARGFAGDIPSLTKILKAAISHKGFGVVDILQPCVTFDKIHTYQWYRERIQAVAQPLKTRSEALTNVMWGEKIPVGLFYQEQKETSEDRELTGILAHASLGIPYRDALLKNFQ